MQLFYKGRTDFSQTEEALLDKTLEDPRTPGQVGFVHVIVLYASIFFGADLSLVWYHFKRDIRRAPMSRQLDPWRRSKSRREIVEAECSLSGLAFHCDNSIHNNVVDRNGCTNV